MPAYRFHMPPTWPQAPAGWTPPPGWHPDPSWPPPPFGWQFWTTETDAGPATSMAPNATAGPAAPPAPWMPPSPDATGPMRPPQGPPPVFAVRAGTPQIHPVAPPAPTTGSRLGAGLGCLLWAVGILVPLGGLIAGYVAVQDALGSLP